MQPVNTIHDQSWIQKVLILMIAFVCIAAIGALRIITGPEYALSLLFFFPILGCCWYLSPRVGYIAAIFSGVTWFLADLTFVGTFSHTLVPFINETLRLIVFMAGVYLLARLKEALTNEKQMALTDPLTGIFNRRAFETMANLELDRFRRHQIPFSVLFFDIDNFKTINDSYGHQTGDILLKCVAHTIQKNIRSIDTFSRLGGDEFILILSGAQKNLAASGAKKIRKVLQDEMRVRGWQVTFSIGVVVFLTPPSDLMELFSMADQAMYAAKQNGKNQDEYREFVDLSEPITITS